MGWSLGYDNRWKRDIGYGVPAVCDHPRCHAEIDRGLSYVCGGEPYGGDGCGLFFCVNHLNSYRSKRGGESFPACPKCQRYEPPYRPKKDVRRWVAWKLTDDSWAKWRDENPDKVAEMKAAYPDYEQEDFSDERDVSGEITYVGKDK